MVSDIKDLKKVFLRTADRISVEILKKEKYVFYCIYDTWLYKKFKKPSCITGLYIVYQRIIHTENLDIRINEDCPRIQNIEN